MIPTRFRQFAIGLGCILLLASGCRVERGSASGADGILAERFTVGRLSGATAWRACVPTDTAAIVGRWRCESSPPAPGAFATRRIAGDAGDTESLVRDAVSNLRSSGASPASVDAAIRQLEEARALAPGSAAILNDIAVAYLLQGERDQRLSPMLHALDAIERAAALDSTLMQVRFNRALIHQRLYLMGGAKEAWQRYVEVEADAGWRGEAQAEASRVAAYADTLNWAPQIQAPPAAPDSAWIAERVRRSPQKAREAGIALLGKWGAAADSGRTDEANRALALARRIGAEMEHFGMDRGVFRSVRAIDAAARDRPRLRSLARAHAELRSGMGLYRSNELRLAVRVLACAEPALRAAGSAAAQWAAIYAGGAEMNRVRYAEADHAFRRALAGAPRDEPALKGKALLALGLSQMRQGNYKAAIDFYRRAEPFVDRSGETENVGSAALMLGEALWNAGQVPDAQAEGFRALRILAPYRRSTFLNNHLAIVAAMARSEGLRFAARAITGEMVGVARATGMAHVIALALCTHARDEAATGRRAAAGADADEAARWLERVPDDRDGRRLRANVDLARGQLLRGSDPAAAIRFLTAAATAYRTFERDLYLPTTLTEAALASAASGDTASAHTWLHEALRHIERQQVSFESDDRIATFSETVENVFDALIALEVAAGRPDTAFAALERSRLASWSASPRRAIAATVPSPRRVTALLAPDEVFVEYALLSDRLVIWTATRKGWRAQSFPIARDTVARLVETLAREAPRTHARGARTRLYELLLRPLAPELEGARRLTVVPDRELGRLPFVALQDAAGRYVTESLEVRTLPSATFLRAGVGDASARIIGSGEAVVVGNPSLSAALARDLPPLPASEREAREVARLHPGSRLLVRSAASEPAVRALLPRARIFHFAGHAVFDSDHPEQSFLALAADTGRIQGQLPAWKIGGLRLSNLQVVVLSACSSLTPRSSHTGAATGLAYSFLRAGAPATISTVWDVNDAATMPLLVDFHRRLAAGASPADALRRAQVAALRSGDGALAAPAAWAAFIYTGP